MEREVGFLIALVSFIVMLVLQTGAMFYWGGTMSRAMRDHERRLEVLERLHPRDSA
jgi:hypothetical protein